MLCEAAGLRRLMSAQTLDVILDEGELTNSRVPKCTCVCQAIVA